MTNSEKPTLAAILTKHLWSGPLGHNWLTKCIGCGWAGDTRNTGKTCISLHADHVASLLIEEHGYQLPEYAEGDDPDEPHAWCPADQFDAERPVTHRRWVSHWERVQ